MSNWWRALLRLTWNRAGFVRLAPVNRVHDLRAAKKWSQEEFAHISGLHRTYIGQIERGEKNVSFDNLSRVAGALGVNLSALLEGLESGAPTNLKSLKVETGRQTGRREATAGEQLKTQKLVKRLKIQHAEMRRTIQALENLPAKRVRRTKRSHAKP